MKTRRWTLLVLTGLLLAWAIPAFAAPASPEEPNRVLRHPEAKGAILEVTVLDTKGRPVPGAKITAIGSDMRETHVVTGPNGVAVLDGLPTDSKGTVHAKDKLRAVDWDIKIEHGRINYLTIRHNVLCYGVYPRKYRNPLVVKLPTEQTRFERRWAPVSYKGGVYPVRNDRFLDESTQQLTYHPTGRGEITQAYFRPWGEHEGDAEKPMVRWWHISVYSYVNCDRTTRPASE